MEDLDATICLGQRTMGTEPQDATQTARQASLPTLRRLLQPLARRRSLAAALLFTLAMAPLGLHLPGSDEPLPSWPDNPEPPEYECLRHLIPPDANVVFFSEPDGSFDLDKPLPLFRAQSLLAPRLLLTRSSGFRATSDMEWFLGTVPSQAAAHALAAGHGLEVVDRCGGLTVFRQRP